jgi:2-keto-4-pentenoate hydratase/2-oxohepta-3-ene-1,7-dioic acid hydratase in catechol pathway
MRYAKLATAEGAMYVEVEEREGVLWAVAPVAAPDEDPLPTLRPAVNFRAAELFSFELLPPVRPSKIVCVGRNYRDHAAELGNEVPKEPLLFLKPPSSLLGHGATILLPKQSTRVDFEGELAVVIGRRCCKLAPGTDVRPFIRGYTIVNDVTARDLQKTDDQWTRAKGFDTFCPVGPIVSDEIDLVSGPAVRVHTSLSGEPRQNGSTADLIFGIAELLVYISSVMTLEPGDLLATGTPAGVGPMRDGDVVEVAIDGLGILRNLVTP